MTEYIEKEAAKRAFFHKGNEFVYYGTDVHDRLDELPAVEVVRCRECKRWTPINNEESYGWCSLDCEATRKEMHFCGYGKRREEDA